MQPYIYFLTDMFILMAKNKRDNTCFLYNLFVSFLCIHSSYEDISRMFSDDLINVYAKAIYMLYELF